MGSLIEKDPVAFQKIIIDTNNETSLTLLKENALKADLNETLLSS